MSEFKSSGLSQEFLDDFFTEADEHLLNVRRALTGLTDQEVEANDPKLVEELFHNFHSFKGISAIVGLEPAEALAHAAEDLLRPMRGGKMESSQNTLQILNATTNMLEQIVGAFRLHKPFPDHRALLAEIKREFSSSSVSDAKAAPVKKNLAGHPGDSKKKSRPGAKVWKYTFSPSQELNAQKININTIREDLSKLGEILKSTPVVKGRGLITFEFLIAGEEAPKNVKKWEAKGVTIEPATELETPSAPLESASPQTTESEHSPFLAPSHVVRVDLKRLDDLLRIVGEMVIHRSRLDIQLGRLNAGGGHIDLRDVQEVNRMLGRSLRQMREDIMRLRLIPIAEIFARLPFVINDLARQTAKKVRLKMEGQQTAIDKYLIEKLKDPLLHMVRNAFSHGIETVAERKVMGKPEEATIELSASAAGDVVIIKVRDDGKGINADAIFQRAKKLGLKIPPAADSEAVLNVLCSPGFSTRDDADRISGRGVGMAVVQTTMQELGGKLSLETEAGRGTQFTLRLPLTVVIAETLLVSAAGQTCAVPQSSVREIFQATEADIKVADGIEMIPYRGGVLPITRLAGLFHLKSKNPGLRCVLVITSERGSIGLLVEKVLGQREVVVRTFRDPLIQVAGVSGATELGDGKPVLILDGAALTAGQVRPVDGLNFTHK
jgi:two-component system, chemotaxis family, sensor kinase CheA